MMLAVIIWLTLQYYDTFAVIPWVCRNAVIITWHYTNFQKRKFLFSRKLKSCITQGHTNFQKRKFVCWLFSHSIRFDSDRIEFHQFRFDLQITNSNRIWIKFEFESESDSIQRIVCETLHFIEVFCDLYMTFILVSLFPFTNLTFYFITYC